MNAKDIDSLFKEAEQHMKSANEHTKHELAGVRTGRASIGILDGVKIEAYGTTVPLNQVANLSVPEPTLIAAQPFDPSLMSTIEKAIQSANLGLNPNNDGKMIRIPIPPLNDERRQELSKVVHSFAENSRNRVRGVRRDANDQLKKMLKAKEISEDDERRAHDRIQELTDRAVKTIDELQEKKDAELLSH
jgi:ribosome recycling factor|tara:strand:- start:6451 stop:7020 length:570 start_codon:yes stop_codon:yes gene_type:complete